MAEPYHDFSLYFFSHDTFKTRPFDFYAQELILFSALPFFANNSLGQAQKDDLLSIVEAELNRETTEFKKLISLLISLRIEFMTPIQDICRLHLEA